MLTTPRFIAAVGVGVVVILTGGIWSALRAVPTSAPPAPLAARVVIVGIPGLRWSDVGSVQMPSITALARRGALGALSVRTESRHPNVVEGYATLGAGGRVRASGDDASVPTMSALRAANRHHHLPSLPGALGDALRAAGRRTAVVGRPAAAVGLMDSRGHVDDLTVGSDVAATTPAELAARVTQTLVDTDVVLVDAGGTAADGRRRGDAVLGELAASLRPDARLLVVSVVPPRPVSASGSGGARPAPATWRLTPVVVAGRGVTRGYLVSPSTHRLGLVVLTDIAPTVMASLGLPRPSAMVGRSVQLHRGPADAARLDRDAVYREQIYFPVTLAFIVLQALVYAVAALVLWYRRGRPPLAAAFRAISLGIAAFPLATFLFRAVPAAPLGWAGVAVLIVIDVALVAIVWGRRSHPLQALGWLLGATIAMFVVDVCTGARLQQASIMGYSPHTATRYYGIGNTALGVLAATTILFSAIYLERARRRADALVVVAALFFVVIVVDSAPQLGAKVGGILTLVPVLALLLSAFSGRRVSWRQVAVVGAALALVLLGAIGVELLRPPSARSHLGQLVSHMGTSGVAPLLTTMSRKEATNLRVARASVWTWMVPIMAGFMLFLLVFGKWAELLPPRSARRQAVAAALVAGLVGFAVDDSGVVVTALVFVYLGPFLLLLALAAAESPELSGPVGRSTPA